MRDLVDYLHDVFERFGPIIVRKMFGGYGIYRDRLMFALVSDDLLYLKADGENAQHFEELGLGKFRYRSGEKIVAMSYYLAPPEIMEDREQAAIWARKAYDAALRSRRKKR